MKTILLVIILTIQWMPVTNAQVNLEWEKRRNGAGNQGDEAVEIALDNSGNVYVTGNETAANGKTNISTIKYNSGGVQQWVKIYNGPANDYDKANSIAVDVSGNVYVTGYSRVTALDADIVTIKYNTDGTELWVKTYGGGANEFDEGYSIAVGNSGNVFVAGYSQWNSSDYDFTVIKYNSAGVQQWAERYNGTGNVRDYAFSVTADDAGNVYATGECNDPTDPDAVTIKYSPSGTVLWLQIYNGPSGGLDGTGEIRVDAVGNVYAAGIRNSDPLGFSGDFCTIKYNSSGVQQWVRGYDGPAGGYDYISALGVDGFGNVYVTGGSKGNGSEYDFATIKYNSSGNQQWVERYNGSENSYDAAKSLALDASGNIYVTGYVTGQSDNYNFATIKYNPAGVQQWIKTYNAPADDDDISNSIALDGSGNVYITGRSIGIGTGDDMLTIKYSQSIGIQQIYGTVPAEYLLSQNYPNPFNPVTNIKFSLPKTGYVNVTVFDISGREITTLVNEQLSAGVYKADFDGSNLSSGVYFYRIIAGEFSEVKKMTLVK